MRLVFGAAVGVLIVASAVPQRPASAQHGSAQCSRAAALETARRIHYRATDDVQGVAAVLCGAFAGQGSQVMVASFFGPGNVGLIDWAIFRLASGEWQLVLTRHEAARFAAVGTDIRETMDVYRSSDPRCCPSGGTRSQVWHWNGSRFVGSGWRYSKPQGPTSPGGASSKLFSFESPSRNIWCATGDEDKAFCVTKDPLRSVVLTHDGTFVICSSGCSSALRLNFGPTVPVLAYGHSNLQGGYLCKSEMTGMTCTDTLAGTGHGKGFTINRAGITKIG
jgi:hypothetical protein